MGQIEDILALSSDFASVPFDIHLLRSYAMSSPIPYPHHRFIYEPAGEPKISFIIPSTGSFSLDISGSLVPDGSAPSWCTVLASRLRRLTQDTEWVGGYSLDFDRYRLPVDVANPKLGIVGLSYGRVRKALEEQRQKALGMNKTYRVLDRLFSQGVFSLLTYRGFLAQQGKEAKAPAAVLFPPWDELLEAYCSLHHFASLYREGQRLLEKGRSFLPEATWKDYYRELRLVGIAASIWLETTLDPLAALSLGSRLAGIFLKEIRPAINQAIPENLTFPVDSPGQSGSEETQEGRCDTTKGLPAEA